jgi:hypothetical protein
MAFYKDKKEIASLADWEAWAGPKSKDQWVPDRSAMEAARSWLHDGGKSLPSKWLAFWKPIRISGQ